MTWYPATCPVWCDGEHPAILAAFDYLDDASPAEVAELVTHSATLASAGEIGLELALNEQHTEQGSLFWLPTVVVSLPNGDMIELEPAAARDLGRALVTAANRAEVLLAQGGQL